MLGDNFFRSESANSRIEHTDVKQFHFSGTKVLGVKHLFSAFFVACIRMPVQSTSRTLSLRLQRLLGPAVAPSLSASLSVERCDRPSRERPRGYLISSDNTSTLQHNFSTLSYPSRHSVYLRLRPQSPSSSRPLLPRASHSTKSPSTPDSSQASSSSDEAQTAMSSGKCILFLLPC